MSPSAPNRLCALLLAGRVVHLPAVLCVTFVATSLGEDSHFTQNYGGTAFFASSIGYSLVALLSTTFFLAATFLNEASNARFDAVHQPDRPIPSGVLSLSFVSITGYTLLCASWFLGCIFNFIYEAILFDFTWQEIFAAIRSGFFLEEILRFRQVLLSSVLAVAILVFAKCQRRFPSEAPFLLGACALTLVLWVFACMSRHGGMWNEWLSPQHFLFGIAVFLYAFGLRNAAREPTGPAEPRISHLLFLLPPLALAGAIFFFDGASLYHITTTRTVTVFGPLVLPAVLFTSWTLRASVAYRHSPSSFFARASSGACLAAALFAALSTWHLVLTCFLLFALSLLCQRRLLPPP